MKKRSKFNYVVLQEYIPEAEKQTIKRAIRRVYPRVLAPTAFVEQLSQDLIAEAYHRQHNPMRHALRTYGLVGGGALSIAGGFLIWLLLKKQRVHEPLTAGLSPQT